MTQELLITLFLCGCLGIVYYVVFDNHHRNERIDSEKFKGIYSKTDYYDE